MADVISEIERDRTKALNAMYRGIARAKQSNPVLTRTVEREMDHGRISIGDGEGMLNTLASDLEIIGAIVTVLDKRGIKVAMKEITADRVLERYSAYKSKFWMPRSSYLPPEVRGTEPYVPKGTDMAIWTYEGEGRDGKLKYYAIAFVGKQSKPYFNYVYRDENHRERELKHHIESRRDVLESKEKTRQERLKFRHEFNVGDILSASWGYDQTNVDFFQVTNIIGPKFVEIQELAQKTVDSKDTADYVVPIPGRFARHSKPMKKRVAPGHSVKIESFEHAYKWDGKPKYQTGALYGH